MTDATIATVKVFASNAELIPAWLTNNCWDFNILATGVNGSQGLETIRWIVLKAAHNWSVGDSSTAW